MYLCIEGNSNLIAKFYLQTAQYVITNLYHRIYCYSRCRPCRQHHGLCLDESRHCRRSRQKRRQQALRIKPCATATGEFHKTATRRRRPKMGYYRTLSCNAMELRIGDRRRFPPRHENDAQALARRQLSIHLRERPSRVQGKGRPHPFVADR